MNTKISEQEVDYFFFRIIDSGPSLSALMIFDRRFPMSFSKSSVRKVVSSFFIFLINDSGSFAMNPLA